MNNLSNSDTVKRRIKLYLRTKSGNVITRYQFVNEDDYREMKENKSAAKKMLGLNDDESLEEFVTSKQGYVQDKHGEMVKGELRSEKCNTKQNKTTTTTPTKNETHTT